MPGLFLTNNVTFIAINGLVGLALAPVPWMATLPVAGYVAGGWTWMNLGTLLPMTLLAAAIGWLAVLRRQARVSMAG